MSLSEFLLARITEDQFWVFSAWAAQSHAGGCDTCGASFLRAAAEVDAKRRIVDANFEVGSQEDDWDLGYDAGAEATRQTILRLLALPYADHPDYDSEWKP